MFQLSPTELPSVRQINKSRAETVTKMEESAWEGQRPDSMLPHEPDMQEGLRMATEAMQAAADAMTAATASFRRQTLLHEELASRRTASLPYRQAEFEEGEFGAAPRRSSSRDRVLSVHQLATALSRDDLRNPQIPDDHNPEYAIPSSRFSAAMAPAASQDGHISTTMLQTPPRLSTHASRSSLATRQASHQNLRGSSRRTTLSEGSTVINKSSGMGAGQQWRVPPEAFQKADPSGPIQPVYEAHYRYAPEYDEPYGSRTNLFQEAERDNRFSASRWPLEQPLPAVAPGGPRDVDKAQDEFFSPILRMGRYTYVRTDTGELGTSLRDPHWHDQQSSTQSTSDRSRASSPPTRSPQDRPYGFSATREVFFLAVIILAQALTMAGLSQALIPQHIIGASFPDTNQGSLAWYSAAYGLTSGSFVLPSGRLGDIFGHKRVFIIGFAWLGLWELAGGFSGYVQRQRGPDGGGSSGTAFFIACRAMQGVGAALLVPNGQAMIGRGYPPGPRKNVVMSLFGAAAPLGFVAGGAMASLFAQLVSWPWAFWTMAAVCVGLAGVSVLVLPPAGERATREAGVSLWKQIDGAGVFLGVSGLVLFNFAFNQAPIVSWRTPYVYFILVIGALLLGGFVYVELHASHPLVPIAGMTPTTNFVLGCTGAGWACFSIWVYCEYFPGGLT